MSGELATRAFCWRVERKDGFGVALTSHDEALTVEGVRYEPAPGMTPATIRRELGLEPSTSEVSGALHSASITEDDLINGRWDDAALSLSVVDWATPQTTRQTLLSGRLADVTAKGVEFSADLQGAAAVLNRPVCPQTSPECRANLGDRECRVNLAGRCSRARVLAHEGHRLTVDQEITGEFALGRIRCLGGAMNGLTFTILAVEGSVLTLRAAPLRSIEPGTPVWLTQGCDKTLATCSARFGNAANFRGEPYLPGNELLTRYPGY